MRETEWIFMRYQPQCKVFIWLANDMSALQIHHFYETQTSNGNFLFGLQMTFVCFVDTSLFCP